MRFVKVAEVNENAKNGLKWVNWKSLSDLGYKLDTVRKKYSRSPEYFRLDNFYLYMMDVSREDMEKAYQSCLKIAGGDYALALIVADGDYNSKAFHNAMYICKKGRYRLKSYKFFEEFICQYGTYVALKKGAKYNFFKSKSNHNPQYLKNLWKESPSSFYATADKLYFLNAERQNGIEKMFFECLALFQSEYALALELERREPTRSVNAYQMQLHRMDFKRAMSFKTYAQLFEAILIEKEAKNG